MRVLICFTGLVRTVLKASDNLKAHLYNSTDSFTTIFVTWESENTDDFSRCFPDAKIIKIPNVYIEDAHFIDWKKNTMMHNSWSFNYRGHHMALFQYYRQIYLWKKAAKILESYENIDVFVRARTDIIVNGNTVHTYYDKVGSASIVCTNEPKCDVMIPGNACPDYIMFGNKMNLLYALSIIDNVNTLYNKYGYSIQPETTMYLHLLDKDIKLHYMNNSIIAIRPNNKDTLSTNIQSATKP